MSLLAAKPNDQIVMTKWAGLSGTYTIAQERQEELKQRYTSDFIQKALAYADYLQYDKEYEVLQNIGYHALVEASYGGIFGALFQLGYDSDLGVMADLEKIPILQQTIEFSEFYQLNPYLLHSSGAMVIASSRGEELVLQLKKIGIEAAVIGHMTEDKARIVYLKEECRYLVPPRRDEIFKCFPDPSYRKRFPKNIVER